jgi:hypothetical protein
MYKHLTYAKRPQSEVDTRFPIQAPAQAERGGAAECVAVKGYMREQYADALAAFEREVRDEMTPKVAQLCGEERVAREQNAALAAVAEKTGRSTRRRVERVRRGAAKEIADLQAQIAAARARKEEAPLHDPHAEIKAKRDELAAVEDAALVEFGELQAVLVCARRHLAAELRTLVALSDGSQSEERTADMLGKRLLSGESIAEIAGDLEEQWTRLAF